jgi:hypothetical protein
VKTFWTVVGTLGFLGGAAFLVLFPLVWTKILPIEPVIVSLGAMGLATGLFTLREAFGSAGPRGTWNRSDVPVGRLSLFAFGLAFCAGGVISLGYFWLKDHEVPRLVLAGAVFVGLVLVVPCQWLDGRQYEASRAAVRRRGWLLAPRRADDDLSADEVYRRQAARATLRRFIQERLTGRTTWERAEAQCPYLAAPARDGITVLAAPARDGITVGGPLGITLKSQSVCLAAPARDPAAPTDWPHVADEWRAFRSAALEGDELWGFRTDSARGGPGEVGFALLRDGRVVDCFITAVIG